MQRMPIHGTAITAVALLIAATSSQTATAGQTIQLLFSGSDAYGRPFAGCVQYDQSKPQDTPNYFQFDRSGFHHEICFLTETGLHGSGAEDSCDPFSMNIAANNNRGIEVIAKLGNYIVYATVFTNVEFGPSSPLPYCDSGYTPVFCSGGTFQVGDENGATFYSGTINSVICTQPGDANPHCPPCTLSTFPSGGLYPGVCDAIAAAAPCSPATYACPPRRMCCLTRLFSARSCRRRCW